MKNLLLSKRQVSFLLLIIAFSLVNIFGIWHAFGMGMKDDGTMTHCPFAGQAAICTMTFVEHLGIWQSMFTAVPQKIGLSGFLILVLAFALVAIWQDLRLSLTRATSRWKVRLKQNSFFQFFDHLQETFSQGILNPKIFESAIV